MSYLLRRPDRVNHTGRIHQITPQNIPWQYVGFEVYKLEKGQSISAETGNQEVCNVLLAGKATVQDKQEKWENIGERQDVFAKQAPYSVYIPNNNRFRIEALSKLEVAICKAPGRGTHKSRLIPPAKVSYEERGKGTNVRHVYNILPENEPADSLLVVEVITPAGHWSSYPPHKHDTDRLPVESLLEETYYHRFNPAQGFGFHRVYTEDLSLDETMTVQNQDVILVPKGYHPFGAAHGYESYYLNVMAGPRRVWKFYNHPQHEWMI